MTAYVQLAVAILLAACGGGDAVVDICERAGQRCRVAEGVIGICNESPPGTSCPEGPPCLVCTPQH
jgi:hypothetical protein